MKPPSPQDSRAATVESPPTPSSLPQGWRGRRGLLTPLCRASSPLPPCHGGVAWHSLLHGCWQRAGSLHGDNSVHSQIILPLPCARRNFIKPRNRASERERKLTARRRDTLGFSCWEAYTRRLALLHLALLLSCRLSSSERVPRPDAGKTIRISKQMSLA